MTLETLVRPTETVILAEDGLTVTLTDGRLAYFNYHWLRDNCPTSFGASTRERSFDIFALDRAPKASDARIEDGTLAIRWRDEDHETRLPVSLLAEYADGCPRKDPADLPRRAWYAGDFGTIQRFSRPDLMADQRAVTAWIEALLCDGFAIVTDMPDSDDGLTETARLLGEIRPTFFGAYFDVRTKIDPTNTAYSAAALELHTDVPAEEAAPGIQYLHCRANSVAGGCSLYADGVAVANDFREVDPEGFRMLSEISIPFYCEHDDYDMRSRQTVIELDAADEVSGLTISQHMLDMIDLPQTQLDTFYPALCRFGRMLQEDRYVMRFRMNAGECMVFDNHRIVHGREAYAATSGERHLRGCYTDRAEMRSKYRVLKGTGRFPS